MSKPSRDPGPAIKRQLRQEVNFGCPVRFANGTGCGCPILTYHHFDPPWKECHAHDVAGIVALCPHHHAQADGGVWSKTQLRAFKAHPYVDDAVRVQWPWRSEVLVMKVGPSLVVGSGCAMRLDSRPVMRFRPQAITALGTRTVEFEADVRDQAGSTWLSIAQSWFDLRLQGTTDVEFAPLARTINLRHTSGMFLSMRFRSVPFGEFRTWLPSVMSNAAIAESAAASVERIGAIDSDGNVPLVEFEGLLRSRHVTVDVRGDRMHFECHIPGIAEAFDWHSWVVNEANRALLCIDNGPEFFSLG